ncbi:hypothetical protein Tcan_00358 [Toxocara canis]|uniref:Uncharacterized protein n=1 Tax=Toxocara canis TaxID=6265 RepID=A0A0B2VF89_TOXCA|nr:hypothetical protein Tcan_00358 [Toxocara canis]
MFSSQSHLCTEVAISETVFGTNPERSVSIVIRFHSLLRPLKLAYTCQPQFLECWRIIGISRMTVPFNFGMKIFMVQVCCTLTFEQRLIAFRRKFWDMCFTAMAIDMALLEAHRNCIQFYCCRPSAC